MGADAKKGRERETFHLYNCITIMSLGTLTYGRGPPGPVVNGVRSTHDGVVNLWPNTMLRLRKAATLSKSSVHSPASRSLEGQAVAQKVEFSERPSLA